MHKQIQSAIEVSAIGFDAVRLVAEDMGSGLARFARWTGSKALELIDQADAYMCDYGDEDSDR